MNAFRQLFENVLFEFDWGQADPENAVADPANFELTPEEIKSNAEYEPLIAKYLNWYAKCQACQGAGGAGIHLTPQGIDFRGRTLSAIYTRLVQTDRHHPALLVYSHDCQLLQQDSICTPPYSRYISIRKIKNSPFIHVYTIF